VKSLENQIKNYLNAEGKLISFPSKRKLKIAAMFYIAASIDEEVRYSEKEINDIINKMCCFNDAALLRREMYNYRFINRTLDGKIYWKEKIQPIPEQYDLS
jgi:Uncharacterized protein conserved in bacteria